MGSELKLVRSEDDASARGPAATIAWRGSNADLLEALKEGGAGAWSVFYERYGSLVNGTVLRLLGDDPAVDDLVQDVLQRLVEGVDRVREPEALKGWVRAVAVNTVKSELRRRYVRRIMTFDTRVVERVEGAGEDLEARSTLRAVYGVLERFSPELRIAFTLRYIEGCSLQEVADAGGWSLATAKRRLRKARGRFETLAANVPELRRRLERGERWT